MIRRQCDGCKNQMLIPDNSYKKFCSTECYQKFIKKHSEGRYRRYLRLRFEVFKRDNFTCQYCGRNVKEDGVKLHCDHIIPQSKGGEDNMKNLITSCMECNSGKSDVLLEFRNVKYE